MVASIEKIKKMHSKQRVILRKAQETRLVSSLIEGKMRNMLIFSDEKSRFSRLLMSS